MALTWKRGLSLTAAAMFAALGAFAQQSANPNGNMSPQTSAAASSDTALPSNHGGKMHSGMKTADTRFAREAATGGMEEVELGKIAVKNGQSDQVKQFGQRMIDDHSKAGDQLKSIAAKDNISLPASLDPKQQAMVDKFSKMSGSAFDRAYIKDMVKDHEKDVAAFENEASTGSNMDLKNFASSTLPTLQDHLKMAKEASAGVGAMSSK